MRELENQLTYQQDGPIDLFELWGILWRDKALIVCVTLFISLASIIFALVQTDIYRSEALLVPAEASQPNDPLLAQLGVAAGLVGINTGSNQSNQVTKAIATLQSRNFLRQFINRHNLKPALFDREEFGESDLPSDQQAYRVISSILSVTENQTNGLVTIAIEWHDPQQARDWVTWLIEDVNELIKQQDLREATSAIEYLQKQLQSTQLVEMQRAFYQLIESQTRIVMLADVRDYYVFRVVDPAFIPEEKIRPRRSTISIVGTVLGSALAILLALARHAIRSREIIVEN